MNLFVQPYDNLGKGLSSFQDYLSHFSRAMNTGMQLMNPFSPRFDVMNIQAKFVMTCWIFAPVPN
jgi:hypothetical protein